MMTKQKFSNKTKNGLFRSIESSVQLPTIFGFIKRVKKEVC